MNDFLDNEECFGFHSEYYINPKWRLMNRKCTAQGEEIVRKGYMEYSEYKGDIYCIRGSGANDVILKVNPYEEKTSIVLIDNDNKKDYRYIAVNRQGYYLYNEYEISLFGFDGKKIYTHKFGQKNYMECVYIYDDTVFYSETKTTGIVTRIKAINMLTQTERTLWETQKGDSFFDRCLRSYYKQVWGTELSYFPNPSNIGGISCEFLYANEKRVVAGYTRCQSNRISYIVNVDLETGRYCFLEVYPGDGSYESWGIPTKKHIFSFHMLDDTMWVKTNDEEVRLVHTEIQQIHSLQGKYPVEWRFGKLDLNNASFYYFDGKKAYKPENLDLYLIKNNGERLVADFHSYQTCAFWCFGDAFITERSCIKRGCKEEGNIQYYSIKWSEVEKLTKIAREQKLTSVQTVDKVPSFCSGFFFEKSQKFSKNADF